MKRRLILIAAAALAPTVAILGYNEFAARRNVSKQVAIKALEDNRQANSEIERIFEGVRALLVATSAMPAVRNAQAEPAECRQSLEFVVAAAPWIRTILVIDPAGSLVCDTLGTSSPSDFSDRDYFKNAMRGSEFVVGGFTNSRISSSPILPVSVPLRVRDGPVTGVVATAIRLDWFNERLRERGLGRGNALTVADRDGMILARYPDPERFVGTRIPEPFMKLVKAEARGTLDIVSQDGTSRVLGYSPSTTSPLGLYVSVGISKDQAFAELNRQTFVGIASIVLGVVVALLAAWSASSLIRRPVALISRVIHDWKNGIAGSRTALKGEAGDVESIGADLDQLLDELERRQGDTHRAEQQRDLLMRELAHRVKNTLALVQAIANQTVGRHDHEMGRAFTERLIALSGTYDVLLGGQFTGGDLETIVRTTLRPHQTDERRVTVSGLATEVPSQTALALSLVIHELATNATKYGALSNDRGAIDIIWTREGSIVSLTWQERDGPLVAPPQQTGFGSKLITRAFGAEAQAQVDLKFLTVGVRCEIRFSVGTGQDAPLADVHAHPALAVRATS